MKTYQTYNRKRAVFGLAAVMLSLTIIIPSAAADKSENKQVTTSKTAIDAERSSATWLRSFSGQKISYNSTPMFRSGRIYVVNENVLYELDKTGRIQRSLTLSAPMNSVCYPAQSGDYLYIPLDGGIMQCVQCSSMRPVWTSEGFGGQSLSTVTYHKGYVYAGTTKTPAGKTSGTFYCLDAKDGRTVWTYEDEETGGYYWSGGSVKGNALFFAGDGGILISHSLLTDEVYGRQVLTETGKIRAGIACDSPSGALYTTSNDGMVYRITANDSGNIQSVQASKIVPGAKTANCTSTPAIWNNRLYVGSLADGCGYINVFNAASLTPHYRVMTGKYREVKSSPLISTGYANKENGQTVYVYFTCNALPGGIYRIKDSEGADNAKLMTVFEPVHKQFCLSSVSADADGTLYYSNDSGYLFALGVKAPGPAKQKQTKKVKKPSRIKGKKKKRKWIVTFKKNETNAQTLLYIKNGNKWKKKGGTLSSQYTLVRKSKKNIRLRLRNRKKIGGKWVYSGYTKTYRLH